MSIIRNYGVSLEAENHHCDVFGEYSYRYHRLKLLTEKAKQEKAKQKSRRRYFFAEYDDCIGKMVQAPLLTKRMKTFLAFIMAGAILAASGLILQAAWHFFSDESYLQGIVVLFTIVMVAGLGVGTIFSCLVTDAQKEDKEIGGRAWMMGITGLFWAVMTIVSGEDAAIYPLFIFFSFLPMVNVDGPWWGSYVTMPLILILLGTWCHFEGWVATGLAMIPANIICGLIYQYMVRKPQ